MMKKRLLVIFSALILGLSVLAMPTYAVPKGDEACANAPAEYKSELCPKSPGGNEEKLEQKVGSVLTVVFGLVGIIAVIFVIIGGFKYTTSQGDPGKVQSAKNTIMYSLIGLAVTLSAFAITQFVLNALKG